MKKIITFIFISIIITLIIIFIPKKEKNQEIIYTDINNQVISNKYIENGFNLEIELNNSDNPKLLIIGNNNYEFNIENNKIDIDITNLANDNYKMYILNDNEASNIVNNLDILEQLVRSKINNKLLTFTYNNTLEFKIEDFNYEYDIFIDPGHGGIDIGTYNSIINEADLNLKQSIYEKERYEQHGLKVLMSRTDNKDGMMYENDEWNRAKKRAYLLGYYGVTAKIIYSNHHNSTTNNKTSGYELLVSNTYTKEDLKTELKIIEELNKVYPNNLINNTYQIYSRDYEEGTGYNKINGKTYNYKDYYATIRIPLELFNVKTITYEGCYMSNSANLKWYYQNEGWKIMSEIKIKNYVESLGKTYIPV